MIDCIASHQPELDALCRKFHVRTLELFGSAATEAFDATTSDLDFLVDFESLTPSKHAKCYFGLLFALEDLFGRDVDLVETTAIRNPYFLRSVAKQRTVVYAA